MKTTFFRFLKNLFDDRNNTLADLGYGVLDTAMVETAAYVLRRGDAADE